MAETPKKINIRVLGIYLIILLALIRFVIYPLHESLQEKKILLNEWNKSYKVKSQVFERLKGSQELKNVVEKSELFPQLFDKGVSNSYIQSHILEWIIKMAEKKGLTVVNFEMLEPVVGKSISEVSILIRLKGMPDQVIEILEAIEKDERVLSIRSMEISRSGQDQVFSLTLSAFRIEI